MSVSPNTVGHDLLPEYDFVFCGLGIATCLIIREFERRGILGQHSILIVEPTHKHIPKTLCFWACPTEAIVQDHHDVLQRHWEFAEVPPNPQQSISPNQYYQIESEKLFDSTILLCEQHGIDILRDSVHSIDSARESSNLNTLSIHTTRKTIIGRRVFDGRPIVGSPSDSTSLLQSFVGFFVELSEPRFQECTLTLMDFDIPQDGATQFMYVLPKSPTKALVECTRFGTEIIDIDRATQHIEHYVHNKWGPFSVRQTEQGIIPMSVNMTVPSSLPNCLSIGSRAGAVKPSTGYAFETMYEHAKQICVDLKKQPTIKQPARFTFYDDLLIHILMVKPHLGKDIFAELFRTQKLSNVLKFLRQQTSLWEEAKIFVGLPWSPFLWALLKTRLLNPSIILLVTTCFLVALYQLLPVYTGYIGWGLLGIGMIAIGIPHGALDYHTVGERGVSRWNGPFHMRYWGLIVTMAVLWMINPAIGLGTFVLTSAWHFGQTDFQHWNISTPSPSIFLWGISVLGWIILSHPEESHIVVELLSIKSDPTMYNSIESLLAVACIQVGLLFHTRSPRLFLSMISLFASAWLPLPMAFGLYFIGQHSLEAWTHLKGAVALPEQSLWQEALPLTIGAFLLCTTFALTMSLHPFHLGWLIIAGSCITFPHILYMDSFYRRRGANNGPKAHIL